MFFPVSFFGCNVPPLCKMSLSRPRLAQPTARDGLKSVGTEHIVSHAARPPLSTPPRQMDTFSDLLTRLTFSRECILY
jgi:hypothetical protein